MAKHHHIHPPADMLSVEEALNRILSQVSPLEPVRVNLTEADGLVLEEDIIAPFDVPQHSNSAMDGYAIRARDVTVASKINPSKLRVIDQIRAGDLPKTKLSSGTAIRIMTGAPIPVGSDAVVPYELTDETERLRSGNDLDFIRIFYNSQSGDHIRPAGEDVTKGTTVVVKGRTLDPPSLGMAASLGNAMVYVTRRPIVTILATGDEVQAPSEVPTAGKLFDINTYTIAALAKRYGGTPKLIGIAKDTKEDLRRKLLLAMEGDLVITTAGVSTGAFDIVKDVLSDLGSMSFWAVRMRPSRPIAFGTLKNQEGRDIPHIGLPGNPVSALVAFMQFGRPALAKMMGKTPQPLPIVQAKLTETIVNYDQRRVYSRVALHKRGKMIYAEPIKGEGSNLLSSLINADGLAICPETSPKISKGDLVTVQLIDWRDQYQLFQTSDSSKS